MCAHARSHTPPFHILPLGFNYNPECALERGYPGICIFIFFGIVLNEPLDVPPIILRSCFPLLCHYLSFCMTDFFLLFFHFICLIALKVEARRHPHTPARVRLLWSSPDVTKRMTKCFFVSRLTFSFISF